MSADSEKDRLPFEPNRKRKKAQKVKAEAVSKEATKPTPATLAAKSARSPNRSRREDTSIPEAVSRRMLKRMTFFSGIPVSLGILVFFASYVIIIQDIADLPNAIVLLTTLACFGLSVVGLSYGALSASWDEDSVGTLLGAEQFRVNFERLTGSWRQAREERRNNTGES
jgi:hypothetical protein